jgi:hypothetical protein
MYNIVFSDNMEENHLNQLLFLESVEQQIFQKDSKTKQTLPNS